MKPQIHPLYDAITGTLTYVVYDEAGGHAAIIDPVLNYQANSARISTSSADEALRFIEQHKLTVDWILETHIHADHLSAASYLKDKAGGKIGIGEHICQVQKVFKKMFNLEPEFAADGSQFDYLFAKNETFRIGKLTARALLVPGHTPADIAFQIDDVIFVGDTLFMPDVGSARCDFPGGDAHLMYQSVRQILSFPDETKLFMCHDYPPEGRQMKFVSTVAEQRRHNIHANDAISEVEFISRRKARDATLAKPNLILPSIQINIRAGQLPAPEKNGMRYLKIPLNAV